MSKHVRTTTVTIDGKYFLSGFRDYSTSSWALNNFALILLIKAEIIPRTLDFLNMSRMRTIIGKLFGEYLFATNTTCSSILMAAGDYIEQKISKKIHRSNSNHDWQRTSNMLLVGLALGPAQHTFYKIIDERYPCSSMKSVLKKVAIEQTIASPIYITLFFFFCGMVEKQSLHLCGEELRKKFLDIYVIDCLVWPPSQVINFLFLSPQYRMMYVNFTTMIYDVFLTHIKHMNSKN